MILLDFFQWLCDDPIRFIYAGIVSVFLWFGIQVFLLKKTEKRIVRLLPSFMVGVFILFDILLAFNVFDAKSEGLANMHLAIAGLLEILFGSMLLGILLAWVWYWIKLRKRNI